MFRVATSAKDVSESVTDSAPKPVNPLDAYTELASSTDPLKVFTALASMIPAVFPSRVTKSAADAVVSVTVTASFPRPLIPSVLLADPAYTLFNVAAVPSITATVLASTFPVV